MLCPMNSSPPTVSESDLASDEEEFHSSYRIFLNAVEMLSSAAEEQCRLMGDYNVAWELKADVAAGRYLVGRGYLTKTQEAWVTALVGSLEVADTQILPAGKGREVNLKAMLEPSWEPLRFIAKEVLRQLTPFTELNSKYLGLPNHVA